MKSIITLLALSAAIMWGSLANAQPPMGRFNREEAKTLKVGIYTSVLELTTAEAEKFWPVFNAFENEMEAIREEQHGIRKKMETSFSDMSDKELEAETDKMMALKLKEAELEHLYYAKFKKVLPIQKVALMHRADMMFKKALLEKMREDGVERRPRR